MAIARNTVSGVNMTTALGGMPAVNSDIIISEGSATYSSGTDISTYEQDTFKVARSFRGQVGVASSYLKVDLSAATYAGLLYYDGTNAGDSYFEAKTDIQKTIVVDTGRGTFYAVGGTFTLFEQDAGRSEFGASGVLLTGTINGGETKINDNATAVTLLTCKNMTKAQIERAMTTAVFTNCQGLVFDSYADAIATLTLEDSSMIYNGGTITQLYGKPGGVLDLRNIVNDIAITDSTLHKGFTVLHPAGGFTVTWTNAPTLVGGGPEWWQ